MTVPCDVTEPTRDDTIKKGWVAFLEYDAFAEFRRHNPSQRRPPYNEQ